MTNGYGNIHQLDPRNRIPAVVEQSGTSSSQGSDINEIDEIKPSRRQRLEREGWDRAEAELQERRGKRDGNMRLEQEVARKLRE